ncbi:MAG: hypothetical protein ACOYYS_10090 [Chloroflexota bacterium]
MYKLVEVSFVMDSIIFFATTKWRILKSHRLLIVGTDRRLGMLKNLLANQYTEQPITTPGKTGLLAFQR